MFSFKRLGSIATMHFNNPKLNESFAHNLLSTETV